MMILVPFALQKSTNCKIFQSLEVLWEIDSSWRLCLMHMKQHAPPVVALCWLLSSIYWTACVLTERSPLPEHASWDSQAQKWCVLWWWFCCSVGFFRDANLGVKKKKTKHLTDSNTGFPVSGRHLGNKLKKLVYNCHLLMAKLWNKVTVLGVQPTANYSHAEKRLNHKSQT